MKWVSKDEGMRNYYASGSGLTDGLVSLLISLVLNLCYMKHPVVSCELFAI